LSALGILSYSFPVSDESSRDEVDALAKSRNYAHSDEITVSPQVMGSAYEEKIDMFYREHIHEDEEIRYILDGKGYFDVRDQDDKWLRIQVTPGDLLILPSGIYHRFTVDQDNVSYITTTRRLL
jgi:1,2-dihydroxy-3-keto-5-methylthiopentene dioxygenase